MVCKINVRMSCNILYNKFTSSKMRTFSGKFCGIVDLLLLLTFVVSYIYIQILFVCNKKINKGQAHFMNL